MKLGFSSGASAIPCKFADIVESENNSNGGAGVGAGISGGAGVTIDCSAGVEPVTPGFVPASVREWAAVPVPARR